MKKSNDLTSKLDKTNDTLCGLFDLPDVLLYTILTYIAPPTDRASIVCHSFLPLSTSIQTSINQDRQDLWSMILTEYTPPPPTHSKSKSKSKSKTTHSQPLRSSKRLRRNTIKEQVQDCHTLLMDRTYIAYYALDEMVSSSKTPLSLRNLRWIYNHYGPILRCNQYQNPYSMGGVSHRSPGGQSSGTFLMACCRARYCHERVILKCVKELVEQHGALLLEEFGSSSRQLRYTRTTSSTSHPPKRHCRGDTTTPLCIAAARGMSTIVKYFISKGASVHTKGYDSIAMPRKPFRRIKGLYTPLEFAQTMHSNYISCVDISLTAVKQELKSLEKCMQMLKQAETNVL